MHVQIFTEDGSPQDESLSPKIKNLLDKMGLVKLEDLLIYTADDLVTHWCGMRVLTIVRDALATKGLKLKGD